jgi:hypothetical protein
MYGVKIIHLTIDTDIIMYKIIKKFKGGSLSSTNLIELNGEKIVRKSASLIENRIYGFQRWYSQLKKMQRYSILYPNLFPIVIRFNIEDNQAFFDMPYIENSINAQEFIEKCNDKKEIDVFFNQLREVMDTLYKNKYKSNPESSHLYIREEIQQRLEDSSSAKFQKFIKNDYIYFNGIKVKSFIHDLEEYNKMFIDSYDRKFEVFTHGNLTLENMLYIPIDQKIILIDPYEENIIDSDITEISQLLQSCNSKYEMYNAKNPIVTENTVHIDISESFGMNYLNEKLLIYIKENYTKKEYFSIKLFEISQFIRMLPFKMEINEDKMIFFYGLASYLFDLLKKEYVLPKEYEI